MSNPPVLESLETGLLLEAVFQRYGYDFRNYRREPLRRKLQSILETAGLPNLSALQEKVLHDPDGLGLFLKGMVRRSGGLFGGSDHMHTLRKVTAPWMRSCPAPKVWIADCACAADLHAVVILLEEEGVYGRTTIFATAPHETLLDDARRADFPVEDMPEYEENYRRSGGVRSLADYCEKRGDRYVFAAGILGNVTFAQYNLATDASFNEFELICFSPSLGDFAGPLRRRALQLFHDSLPVFGMLSVFDADDADLAPFGMRYKAISSQHGIYRRIA